MKTTLEIPDAIFQQAKAKAAAGGISFRQFVTEALGEKLNAGERPWLKLAGKLRHLRAETARIDRLIEKEFETIDPLDWR